MDQEIFNPIYYLDLMHQWIPVTPNDVNSKDWLTVAISMLALAVSWKAYSRDTPNLKLNMYIGEIIQVGSTTRSGPYLFIQVVNQGKRPTTLQNIGASLKPKWYDLLSRYFNSIKQEGLIWSDVQPIIYDNNKFRLLKDGERVSHQLKISPDGKPSTFEKAKNVWVSDALGKRYYLSNRELRKLKKDLRELPAINTKTTQ